MLFRRLYNDKVIRTMSKDCLKELDFADRDQDIIFEDMQVMTDFELHRFAMGYKVSLSSSSSSFVLTRSPPIASQEVLLDE
jgi:hypothetical protein